MTGLKTKIALLIMLAPQLASSHFKTTKNSPVHINELNQLEYKIEANGDRVPDFSFCGYMSSESPIPDIPVKIIVSPGEGDATVRIQQTIDYVSALPVDKNGFRGTVLLEKGKYILNGSLCIKSSGVILRGSGPEETILIGAGNDRETLIRVAGKNDRKIHEFVKLESKYFPVNSTKLSFSNPHPFKIGDKILIKRPSTKEWIEHIGADKIGIYVDYTLTKWEPGDFDINWERTVISVDEYTITIDVPLTNSIDPQWGGGNVARIDWPGRIENSGVENLRCVSEYNSRNEKDENHRWMAITMENICNGWVRRIIAENFVSSAVAVWETAKQVTVEDCKSLHPVGEIGNYRRYAFQTLGQQVLFQRCYAEYAYHAFSVGFTTPGPNAFVQCYSFMPYQFSGSVGGWANGVLFDKMTVDGGNISFGYRDVDGQGGGWSAANSLCWQCRAAQIHLAAPPDAQNWAIASWAQGYGNGHHELEHTFVKPESFYYAQLEARTGKKQAEENKVFVYKSNETTAPVFEMAAQNSERSKTPDITMNEWIDQMIRDYPIQFDLSQAKKSEEIIFSKKTEENKTAAPVSIKNGWIVQGNKVMTGKRNRTSMWRGSTRPSEMLRPAANLVRFVPGRTGRGLTDNLDTLTSDMLRQHVAVMQNFPALWYERRRDDHARTRRTDADVWTPFYEQPFSRSGQGEAFDRLSKYDLNKWNSWYWLRLKKFADLADANGLLFMQEQYLQHNIIEEGAHWADYPWRSANNINGLGFAENPPYAGDKRVYMAVEFYDTTHTVRNHYHRQYIQKSLENFKGNTNIIHHLGMEYTGPVHFADFWLDVIAAWEKDNNENVLVALPGTKDVQDVILSDSKRANMVNVIDIIQWQYRNDGSLYAPPGGVSLAGRQYARIMEPGETSFDQIYRAVDEYRTKYPEKAVLYSRQGAPLSNWASFMAGGSLCNLPESLSDLFLKNAVEMHKVESMNISNQQYTLGKPGIGYIIFCTNSEIVFTPENDTNSYKLDWINPEDGKTSSTKTKIKSENQSLTTPFQGACVAWLHK